MMEILIFPIIKLNDIFNLFVKRLTIVNLMVFGLYTVRTIINTGGRIVSVKSKLSEGTRFEFIWTTIPKES
jgi:hypothetical protein